MKAHIIEPKPKATSQKTPKRNRAMVGAMIAVISGTAVRWDNFGEFTPFVTMSPRKQEKATK